ncbi:hypothetical protein LOZ58_006326 [Ophidiomyces ophidiicola]|nr:hypothetical protein LOZ65_005600 [Ophidiomyces ophidiicola]KAI1933411.1 hypothetical protein LOZ66_006416 [Ophidiomyces ophidiicola]KAI1956398.1 hypothetical protein LOZ58_006326 [Ophidiomyces ophidiicola]
MVSFLRLFSEILIAGTLLVQASPIAQPLSADAISNATASSSTLAIRNGPRPFWLIAHRVLTVGGVDAAIADGANAIEIDVYGWSKGWYADHDGLPTSAGDTVEKMFSHIASQRNGGKTMSFVWLDLKNPDYVRGAVNMGSLRQLARAILQPAGVKVLYGFSGSVKKSAAYKLIASDLNENESVGIDGNVEPALSAFNSFGPSDSKKRVYSKGYFNPLLNLNNIVSELAKAQSSGSFGKVFGWTIAKQSSSTAQRMVNEGNVDGIIYGFVATHYYNHDSARAPLQSIKRELEKIKDKRYLATNSDIPW